MNNLTKEEIKRYSRHLTLEEVGVSGQIKLKKASVLVIGCGGLGSPLLLYLAAAGIGTIGIVDNDVVEESNLQRQIIHNLENINKKKIDSAEEAIKKLNPNINVEKYETRADKENISELMRNYDVVCDGSDNFKTRYIVNDECVNQKKPYIYGAILKFEGQISVFNLTKNSPNYRDIAPREPPSELVPSCAEGGVIGVLPGLIGTIQANEAIKIIVGYGEPLDGRLMLIDAKTMKTREMRIMKQKESIIEKTETYKQINAETITAKQLKKMIETKENIFLIDVRSKEEREICSIRESVNIPLEKLRDKKIINEIRNQGQNKVVIIYCKVGGRSEKAVIKLQDEKIKAVSLEGGILAWINKVDNNLNGY